MSNLLSDIEYRLEVTVRNGALVDSATGTRLITASYGTPETPLMTVTVNDDGGYIEITTSNPEPGSVNLGTTPYTFEVSASAFFSVGGSFARSNTFAASGSWSGLLTASGAPSQAYVRPAQSFSPDIVPGRRYMLTYDAYSPLGYATLNDAIDWYTASGSYLTTSFATAAISASTWTRRSYTGTAPASAARASFGPTLASSPASGAQLYIDNLLIADASDRPSPAYNQILRSELSGEFVVIGTCMPGGSYRDYAAASGVTYTYKVRAVAP